MNSCKKLVHVCVTRLRRIVAIIFVALFFGQVLLPAGVRAASISESYTGESNVTPGMILSTDPTNAGRVVAANLSNSEYLLGVAQTADGSLVNFTGDRAGVAVATSGIVAAYVTNANGSIKKGDYISASWISGVGMKAVLGDNRKAIGVALEDFDMTKAKDVTGLTLPGGNKTAKVSSVAIRLLGTPYKLLQANQSGAQQFIAKIAGHEVSNVRIFVSAFLFIVSLFVTWAFIRNSIGRSFIALGRNPLASHSIFKSLTQISFVSMLVVLIGALIAYAVVVI